MNLYTHPLLRRSLNIPAEIRPDVSEVVNRTRNQFQFTNTDLTYLFEVYNRYIAPATEPENMGCSGCRTKVIGKMREMVTLWQEHGTIVLNA
jgi:hypothetical protein